ncbi:cupredoxin domain-containing protein [Arthrobacter sp. CAN_C5]|uniref:cupredoxin domain-containing protein n=1 Tax=Arthrobacter sp. CAN_C5 TaxID=2760706 RepID=UPI001AE71007|nr:cupredoxin domain-containing protein [Arthrobacter sp. CAN_C5]MBP2215131.1 plastocyanin [Arthrobacter sp. CAN_C5]
MITSNKVLSVAFTAALIAGAGLGSAGAALAAPSPVSQSVPAMTTGQMSISIDDFVFSGPGTVNPGGEITVTNNDSEAHTVTADDGSFDVTIPGGESATFTAPSVIGSYGFFCKFHGNMKGTLTVGAESMAPAPAAPTTPAVPAPAAPAPEVAESGSAGHSGMDQMGAVPRGGADTGVMNEASDGSTIIALGGGLVLLAAAGGTFAVRRRSSNS